MPRLERPIGISEEEETKPFRGTAANDRNIISSKEEMSTSKESIIRSVKEEMEALSLEKDKLLSVLDREEQLCNDYRAILEVFEELKSLRGNEEIPDEIEGIPKFWKEESWKQNLDSLVGRFMQIPINQGANVASVRQEFETMLRRSNIDEQKERYVEYLKGSEEKITKYAELLVSIESRQDKLKMVIEKMTTKEGDQIEEPLAA